MKQIITFVKIYFPYLVVLAGWLAFFACVACMTGCKSVEYVPVPEYHNVYVSHIDTVRDSIYRDVFRNVYIKGDTVYDTKTEYEYRILWRTAYKDSVRVDSVRVPYPVERKLTKWQTLAIDWFGYLAMLTLALLTALVIIIVRYIRKKYCY